MALAACAALWLTACDKPRPDTRFAVNVKVAAELEVDSVSLLVWEEEYGQLRDMGGAALHDGAATIEGVLDAPRAACLHLDSTPFYFVLEPGTTSLMVKPHQVVVTGGPENHRYLDFVKQQASLTARRQQLWQRYVAMGADSTLTADKEHEMARTDSLLADSLQRITLDAINARHPASRLIAERYLHTLDSLHLRQLNY